MIIFQSMTHVTSAVVLTVAVLLFWATRRNPFIAAGQFVQEVFTSRKYLFYFVAMVAVLFMNKLEIALENEMPYPEDFTPSIYRLEGNLVASIQQWFQADWLTYFVSFFYVVVFPAIMIASILLYTALKENRLYYAICIGIMLNYMIAIPFYLFFPVNEVHAFHPDVELLILDVFPTFETDYRPLSDLDNCMPSLHTSISISLAAIALKSNNRFWKIFTCFSAACIIFSIFYLGIHWITDMLAGVALGLFAAALALKLSEERVSLPFGKNGLLSMKKKDSF